MNWNSKLIFVCVCRYCMSLARTNSGTSRYITCKLYCQSCQMPICSCQLPTCEYVDGVLACVALYLYSTRVLPPLKKKCQKKVSVGSHRASVSHFTVDHWYFFTRWRCWRCLYRTNSALYLKNSAYDFMLPSILYDALTL